MEDRERIEQACEAHGLTIKSWEDREDGLTAVIGRFEAVEDSDDEMIFSGDEGELSASVVGAAQYGNQRVCFSFMADDTDAGNEVRDLYILEQMDD